MTDLLHPAAASHDPDAIAIRFRGTELAYGEVERRSDRLARALQGAGIGVGRVVGLLLERGPDLPVAQLAVLKAGAAWTPMDPQHPVARLEVQAADADVALVLTSRELAGSVPAGVPRWRLDDPARVAAVAAQPCGPVDADVRPDDPAYLIYTSGSTGTPKGVLVSHRSAHRFCRNAVDLLAMTAADRVAQVANPAFDMNVLDVHATLLAGAVLVGAPREVVTDPDALTGFLVAEGITVACVPPTLLALMDPERLTHSALRVMDIGGEVLRAELVERWSRPGLELHNCYGPTETTVVVTDHRFPTGIAPPTGNAPPIGTPLPGHRAYVLDRRLRPTPIGIPGELHVSGSGVAHGYLKRPALTACRFLPDHLGGVPGARMYATGDLARWRSDGVLEYLGRTDRQVRLRGQRIEPGEIEDVLCRHPAVRQCAVTLHEEAFLVAYVVGEVDAAELRGHLADHLPISMIPTAMVSLPALPLTSSGKLDTAALPAPHRPAAAHTEPRTETERRLADAWRDLLGVERVGSGDDFFDLGGNSLHITQLVARVRDRLDIELHPRQIFVTPVLGELAALLDARSSEAAGPADAGPDTGSDSGSDADLDEEIEELARQLARKRAVRARRTGTRRVVPVPREPTMPCTVQQEGLWFVDQLDPASPVYLISTALRLRGELDVTALGRALRALVTRHEALRTRFVGDGGAPRQVIDPPPLALPLTVVDVGLDRVQQWVATETRRPLDLASGPVFRAVLARTVPGEHVLVLAVHHIVADGWSATIVEHELSLLYAAETGHAAVGLAPLDVHPADHAAWQRARLDGAELRRQLEHWRDRLAGAPTVDLPADRPRRARPSGAGASTSRRLPDALVAQARGFARREGASFLAVLQAALLTVLHRWTGQDDLSVGSIFSGRTRPEIEPLVGFFANTVVLRTDVGGRPSFAELVRRCHDTVMDAAAHQDLPFGLVVDALAPERIAGRNPLFQICLSLQPARGGGGADGLGGLSAETVEVAGAHARFDVALDLAEGADGALELSVEYSTELFDDDRIARLVDHLVAALGGGLAAPDRCASDIELMSAAERERVLHAWNPRPTGREPGLLHDTVRGGAPGGVAIRFDGADVTYRELDRRSDRLSRALHADGIGPGGVVGLLLDRGPHLPVAQLAVMKCGAAWTLLDPQLPPARLALQADDSGALLVLTTADLADLAPAAVPHRSLDDPDHAALVAALPDTPPPDPGTGPDEAAYLLYTSGSTGRPKGVLVSHRSAYAYCENAVALFRTTAADRVVQVANPAFDASIFDLFATLLAGATMVGVPRHTIVDPPAFTALLHDERVTLAYLPPVILAVLDPARLVGSALRGVFSAGEALGAEQVARWSRPGLELHNSFGPTETTVVCTDHLCPTTPQDGPTPIGRALPDHCAYVLDPSLRPVPVGVAGQLHIAGTGVAHGYVGQQALTAQRFLPDPFGERPGARMYATGDLVRWRSDGVLQYLGRGDRQVKVRGQRIELGEIEHALLRRPEVRQSVVVLRDTVLVAYVVGRPDSGPDVDDLRAALLDELPTYMVPGAWVVLPELPVNPSGKIDMAALPAPVTTAARYVAPRTDVERGLAAIWEELLGSGPVGAGDDFFELGGNSLHATQLVARVRDRLGLELHLRHLFTDPTVERLAARLDAVRNGGPAHDAADAVPDVVTLRAGGAGPALFLVHPVGGSAAAYVGFAQLLGDDHPVHAIEDPGLRGAPRPDDLDARGRHYAGLVRQVQPHGPYRVGGWSLGGLIGLEIARQLTADGEQVEIVLALDSGLPALSPRVDDVDVLGAFVADLAGLVDAAAPAFDLEAYRGLGRDAVEEVVLDTVIRAGFAPAELRADLHARMRVFAANLRAAVGYRPRPYGGRVALVRAADGRTAPELGMWRGCGADLEEHVTPGDHFTLLRTPHVGALAATVRGVLHRCLLSRSLPARPPGSGDRTPGPAGPRIPEGDPASGGRTR